MIFFTGFCFVWFVCSCVTYALLKVLFEKAVRIDPTLNSEGSIGFLIFFGSIVWVLSLAAFVGYLIYSSIELVGNIIYKLIIKFKRNKK